MPSSRGRKVLARSGRLAGTLRASRGIEHCQQSINRALTFITRNYITLHREFRDFLGTIYYNPLLIRVTTKETAGVHRYLCSFRLIRLWEMARAPFSSMLDDEERQRFCLRYRHSRRNRTKSHRENRSSTIWYNRCFCQRRVAICQSRNNPLVEDRRGRYVPRADDDDPWHR